MFVFHYFADTQEIITRYTLQTFYRRDAVVLTLVESGSTNSSIPEDVEENRIMSVKQ